MRTHAMVPAAARPGRGAATTMRAVVFDEYGPPAVLRVATLPAPRPEAGEVRVRVLTAGVQPFDTMVRNGSMPVAVTFPQQLGNEFAGVVDAVGAGAGVEGWAPGDEVIGWAFMRSLADYVIAGASSLVAKPAEMSWPEAGGLSSSGQTAIQALGALDLAAGETLLVQGAAGGAGTMAVQLARAAGVRVIGTAREANHDHLRRLGAIPVTYGEGLADRVHAVAPHGVDAALDAVGGQALRDALDLVGDPRRVVTLVDFDQAERLGTGAVRAQLSHGQLHELVTLVADGQLHVHLRATYPLERIIDAHRDVGSGHGPGKVVIDLRGAR